MEAHHASRGRRTLEEIRQKRAAERMQLQHNPPAAASHIDPYGNQKAGEELLARVKELENGNMELERENQMLLSKIAEKEVEKDSLVNRLNDLERNVVPSLKKALNDISLEKDAAVVAKKDALAQLRSMKKRLKEAEEEQYRAEEDSASLRAQLNTLQQQVMSNSYSAYPVGTSSEQTLAMEKEIQDLQGQLKQESLLRQQEQQKLAEESLLRHQDQQKLAKEQSCTASLAAEKQEFEDKIVVLTKKASEEASEFAARKTFSMVPLDIGPDKLEDQHADGSLGPLHFLHRPGVLFSLIRGEVGKWIAIIAVILRLFFPHHFPDWLELPGALILLILVAPSLFADTFRGDFVGIFICLIIGCYLLQEHIRASGGFRNAFKKGNGVSNTIGICLLFIYPVWALVLKFL